jgi:hypothetical protein
MSKLHPLLRAGLSRGSEALLGTSLRIGLSRSSVALLRTRRWPCRRRELLVERSLDTSSPREIMHGLRAVLADASCARLTTTVVLADEWTRLFMVTPPHNAEKLRDCQAAAALRFQSLYGEPADDWKIDGDWDAQHPFLACALSRPMLAALQKVGAECRLTLVGIVPQFIAAWNCWHRGVQDNAWYATMHADIMTLGVIDRRRLVNVRRLTVPSLAHHDQAWLSEQITREALRLLLPLPARIHLCGSAPGVWFTQGTRVPACAWLDATPHAADGIGESTGAALAYTGARP